MKKKYFMFLSSILIVVFFLTGCSTESPLTPSKSINDIETKTPTIEEKVDKIMDGMTLEEKIAQMLVIYDNSDTVNEDLLHTIKTIQPGGFILMKNNITTYEKTRQFVFDLQQNSTIPMIISIDQEGGSVQRLKYIQNVNVLDIPSMYDLGKTKNEQLAYEVGTVLAQQLKTIGVNVVYAPVLDIYSNMDNTVIGKRSFGANPKLVSTMALSLARGLEDHGIIATYKHFPGHGDTSIDSHDSLPVIEKNYQQLQELELLPFKEAIHNQAKIIMIGHLALPNITNDTIPASLSKTIITDILKIDLGYQGLIITDALNMKALINNYTNEEIYTMAIHAGVDLLLMPNDMNEAIQYIKKNIEEKRINESVKKILMFKYTYLNNYEPLDSSYLNHETQREIINQIPME